MPAWVRYALALGLLALALLLEAYRAPLLLLSGLVLLLGRPRACPRA
ncbi:hypothetical protein GCM10007092_03680 [Thermus composti]|uniref:Uncharacterized protein n=1 Tax=Thermus composti TaxID=532059 RepID=A0ABV6PYX5_9DEIN|nr:hypothetical protein [Thermus composti]GGM93667.1 hypothetical protein GCM10007092_03680 [Thermus composti]